MSIDIATTLTGRLHTAADYIDTHGWTQDADRDSDGRVCATGAVMYCQPRNGDEYLIREVLRQRDRAEDWNDRQPADAGEVVRDYLAAAEISDADLAVTFGPQWEQIVVLVRRCAALTAGEASELAAARDAARAAAWDAAWGAAWGAARVAAWAARDAAWALTTRDLIGQHGYTQDHYDVLRRPWCLTIGPIHPDDTALTP